MKVDLHYPEDLHEAHNDYPLAPERKLVKDHMLSLYARTMKENHGIMRDTCEKLVPNLCDKEGYVCDIRALKFYLEQGLIVTAVHSVLTFDQSPWLKPYISFNTDRRTESKTKFDKDFFKLMSNAVFGKTMENVMGRVDMEFVSSNQKWGHHATKCDKTMMRKLASPYYNRAMLYNEDLVAILKKKRQVVLNKPIFAGLAILDLSKLHMYKFHYNIMKPRYPLRDELRLCFTDTDSLCYKIQTKDFFQDIVGTEEVEGMLEHFDLSDFPQDHPIVNMIAQKMFNTDCDELTSEQREQVLKKKDENKKVLGKFKDECNGTSVSQFIGLRPKLYSLKVGDTTKQAGKGIKTSFLKKHIGHEKFVDCLTSAELAVQRQRETWVKLTTNRQQVSTTRVCKVTLCAFDNKRYLLGDGITSYSYGHKDIALERFMEGGRYDEHGIFDRDPSDFHNMFATEDVVMVEAAEEDSQGDFVGGTSEYIHEQVRPTLCEIC